MFLHEHAYVESILVDGEFELTRLRTCKQLVGAQFAGSLRLLHQAGQFSKS